MSLRAAVLGMALAAVLAGVAYPSDALLGLPPLVGTFLPPAVLGLGVLLLVGRRFVGGRTYGLGRLTSTEIILMIAIGLAGCGWGGFSFLRHFTPTLASPWHWHQTQPAWQSTQVMSYLAGGSPSLGDGHVRDWNRLLEILQSWREDPSTHPELSPILEALSSYDTARLRRLAQTAGPGRDERRELLSILNNFVRGPDQSASMSDTSVQAQRDRRAMLEAALDDIITSSPDARPIILPMEAMESSAVEGFMTGTDTRTQVGLHLVPWRDWAPPLAFWLPFLAALTIALGCLALIVHPQWADRERLAYPIAQFVVELASRDDTSDSRAAGPGRMFWMGAGLAVAIHAVNGAAVYLPSLPDIPLQQQFTPLRTLFPNATRIAASHAVFEPRLYLSIIGLALLLSRQVAFSLGLSALAWVVFGAWMLSVGVRLPASRLEGGGHSLMLFGAYLGCLITIVYVGRRYYGMLLAAAMVGRASPEAPRYAVWALRLLLGTLLVLWALLRSVGLDGGLAALVLMLLLMLYVVVSRIVAETGLVFVQAHWAPLGVIVGLIGFDAIGPTAFLVIAILSLVLCFSVRDTLMPHLTHGLYLYSRSAHVPRPGRFSAWQISAAGLALAFAVVVPLMIQYHHGVNWNDPFAVQNVPQRPFTAAATHLLESESRGDLAHVVTATGAERLGHLTWQRANVIWVALGLSLFLLTAGLRLKLPGWPLHPVLFLLWGTHGANMLAASFVVGWAAKNAIVRLGGARGYHVVKPLAIGLIAGELLSALGWLAVGGIYYLATGTTAPMYRVFPG